MNMYSPYSRVLLLTANVGSIFEEPDKMLPIWMREFIKTIMRIQPEFLAIHCQEVGGKNYEETMQHVNKFIKLLLAKEEMQQFDRARFFLDEDFTAIEKFTALGSLYFIHKSVSNIKIFNFLEKEFISVEGKEVLSGNIEHVAIKEKAKFPQEYFPDLIWSRKGFIRTRWNLCDTVFDLVNIHLFHDISNISAMEKEPSTYSIQREKALLYTVDRFLMDDYENVPFFIFGDYNFRMNTYQLVKDLTSEAEEEKVKGKKNDISAILFKEKVNGKIILKVGKKDFQHFDHNKFFSFEKSKKLRIYDLEPLALKKKLFEFDVNFPPSYPFSENMDDGTSYMPTRCPGWCDRIMMSHDAKNIILNDNENPPEYKMIGEEICMGDHKPIFLSLQIVCKDRQSTSDNSSASITTTKSGNVNVVVCQDQKEKTPVRHVISVNGENRDVNNIDELDIHDNAKFEQEELVTPEFRDFIKSKMVGVGIAHPSGGTTKSFRNVVNHVLRSESVVKIMKRFKHRCDSESESEEDVLGTSKTENINESGDLSLPLDNLKLVDCQNINVECMDNLPDKCPNVTIEGEKSLNNYNENNSNKILSLEEQNYIKVSIAKNEGTDVDGDFSLIPKKDLKKKNKRRCFIQ